jgi:hypothetical protein
MNWKLVFQLSLFGLAMAIATVYVIDSSIEPFVWLIIFVFCAWVMARRLPNRHFVHGLMIGIVNSLWVTSAHIILFDTYVASHVKELESLQQLPLSPRIMMACTGPVIGVVSGLVLGLFAFIAAKIIKQPATQRS